MKLALLKTKTLNAASPAALDTAIAAYVQGLATGEREATFLAIDYHESGGNYSVLITYTL